MAGHPFALLLLLLHTEEGRWQVLRTMFDCDFVSFSLLDLRQANLQTETIAPFVGGMLVRSGG